MDTSKKSSKLGIGIVIGAIFGAIGGMFLAPKKGKELREDAMKFYDQLKDKDADVVVKEIFGVVSAESKSLYKTSKEYLAEELAKMKENAKDIEPGKYKDIVMKALSHVKKDRDVPQKELKLLGDHLEKDVKRLFSGMKDGSKKS